LRELEARMEVTGIRLLDIIFDFLSRLSLSRGLRAV